MFVTMFAHSYTLVFQCSGDLLINYEFMTICQPLTSRGRLFLSLVCRSTGNQGRNKNLMMVNLAWMPPILLIESTTVIDKYNE